MENELGSQTFQEEVADATLMLDYAVENGITVKPDDRKLSDDIIVTIKSAQDAIRDGTTPNAEDRAKFERAYRDLAIFLHPVTAETLKATSEKFSIEAPIWALGGARPISIIWSRKLSAWALIFVAVAVLGDWFGQVWGALPESGQLAGDALPSFRQSLQVVLQILVPFTYGAIGASVYLLKACQAYIHKREFDPRRIPEYYNRMILGAIAGGMIVLLVHQIAGDSGDKTVQFSAAALGFLAGYNNDLLFSAIERISNAILPKVGISSVQQERSRVSVSSTDISGISLQDLLERQKNATDADEKKMLAGLIQKIQERL